MERPVEARLSDNPTVKTLLFENIPLEEGPDGILAYIEKIVSAETKRDIVFDLRLPNIPFPNWILKIEQNLSMWDDIRSLEVDNIRIF